MEWYYLTYKKIFYQLLIDIICIKSILKTLNVPVPPARRPCSFIIVLHHTFPIFFH